MLLSELRDMIEERLDNYEDGEVTICIETIVHGQEMQIGVDINELAACVRYNGETEYMLLNKDFD